MLITHNQANEGQAPEFKPVNQLSETEYWMSLDARQCALDILVNARCEIIVSVGRPCKAWEFLNHAEDHLTRMTTVEAHDEIFDEIMSEKY